MKKTTIILFFVLLSLLIIPLVYAVKPTQVATGDTILEVRVPLVEFIKQNRNVQLNTHLFNKTNGMPITNDSASCKLHVFNETGYHIINIHNLDFDSEHGDFQTDIGGNNFSNIGFYSFMLQCNTSNTGGFVSGSFEVTITGKENETNRLPLILGIIFIVMLSFAFIMLSQTINQFLTHFFFLFTFILTTVLTGVLHRYVTLNDMPFYLFTLVLYRMMLIITALMMFIILVLITIDAVQLRRLKNNPVDHFRDNLGKK